MAIIIFPPNPNQGDTFTADNGVVYTYDGVKWEGATGNLLNVTTDVIPSANVSYSLGNSTNQWQDLWVSGNTIYIGSVPVTVDGATLQVAGANVITATGTSDISVTGNIEASYFLGNGAFLTGISGGGGNANTGNITFDGTTISTNLANTDITIQGNGTGAINITTGANSYTQVTNDSYANGSSYVSLENGKVYVESSSGTWVFNTDGGTIFPTLTTQRGDNPSGTISGQTLLFGNPNQEAIISTPDGTVGNEYSQRLVINPGAGNNFGEGGDIYLWAGRGGDGSGTGGDIKIRGGQGGANTQGGVGGDGGYIRMEAGDAATTGGNPGYIDITGGYSNTVGGYVNVTGGQGNTIGGDVKIYGGYGQATGGNVNIWGGASGNGQANEGHVNIETGGNTWTFSADGTTQFPANTINTAGQLSIKSFDSLLDIQSANTTVGSGGEILLNSGFTGPTSAGVTIAAYVDGTLPALKEWVFDAYGLLTLPADGSITGNTGISFDSSVGGNTSGLYVTGNITEGGNSYLYATNNVYVRADNNGTSKDWVFGADGNLTAPGNLVIGPRPSGGPPGSIIQQNDASIDIVGEGNSIVSMGWVANLSTPSNIALIGINNTVSGAGAGNVMISVGNVATTVYSWVFGNDGNLTLPANTFAVNYANGQPYGGSGSGYSNAAVATFLADYGSNTISTTGSITAGSITQAGIGNINGYNGYFANNLTAQGTVQATSFVSPTGNGTFYGNATTGLDALYAGLPTFTVLGTDVVAQFSANVDSYAQINLQNLNTGNLASADYIITADIGNNSSYYLDLGLAGSNHNDPYFFGDVGFANDGYLQVVGPDSTGPSTVNGPGNLVLGSSNGLIKMFVGNASQANVIATVSSSGLNVLGNITTAGDSGNITGANVISANTLTALSITQTGTGNINGYNGYFANNVTVQGTLQATGLIVPQGNGTFFGNSVSGNSALFAGVPGYTVLGSNVVVQFAGNANSYSQVNFQNIDSGSAATTDYIATADTGTNSTYYLDMGIAGSAYDNTNPNVSLGTSLFPLDSYVFSAGSTNLTPGGNLVVGTITPERVISFIAGGVNDTEIVQVIANTGISVYRSISSTGNIIAGNISTLETGGNITGNTVTAATALVTTATTVDNLPSAVAAGPGARSFVIDSNTITFYSNVGNAGSNSVPVFSDGTSWRVG